MFPSFTSGDNALFAYFIGGSTNFFVGENSNNRQRQFNIVNNLSVTAGSHALKFGVDYRRLTPVFNPRDYTQVLFFFGGVADAADGTAPFVQVTASETDFFPQFTNFSLFAQDTWKATGRLTLTYGLRYEVNPAPSEKNGNLPFTVSGVENSATISLAPRESKFYETTYNNFAPRVGAAYQLSDKTGRETIIRGGFGVFYDLGNGAAGEAFSFGVAPYSRSSFNFDDVPYPLTIALATPPTFNPNPPFNGTVYAFADDFKLPYTLQFNAAVEQSLSRSDTVSATYVGAIGRRQTRLERLIDPNENFSRIDVVRGIASSDYHALQVQYQRRLTKGFQALASYTFSKSLDTASDESTVNAPFSTFDINLDRGASNFDVRHSFTAALTYNIPAPFESSLVRRVFGGFSLDSFIRVRSAAPVNIVTGTDPLNLGLTIVRPDIVAGQPFYLADANAPGGRRFNPAAFVSPPTDPDGNILRQGNLGRNVLRGFPARQVDLALRREFAFTERFRLQLRAELFNVFNTPNFGDPENVLFDGDPNSPNPNFGFFDPNAGTKFGCGRFRRRIQRTLSSRRSAFGTACNQIFYFNFALGLIMQLRKINYFRFFSGSAIRLRNKNCRNQCRRAEKTSVCRSPTS